MTKHWDGTESMPFVSTTVVGKAGDCVARAIAIASGQPYSDVMESEP